MNERDAREVAVDVLPPLPVEARQPSLPPIPASDPLPPFAGFGSFYHPASGVVILGLDWLVFGTDAVTGFLALPALCVLSFIITFPILYVIQTRWGRNPRATALGKAFLGAFMVALPFPITGTMLGAAILALSGLPHHPVDAVRRMATQGRITR